MTKRNWLAACFTLVLTIAGWTVAEDIMATCELDGTTGVEDYAITGTVSFKQQSDSDEVTVTLDLDGFNISDSNTEHGFHVHMDGELGNGCVDAGGHFNPESVDHGAKTGNLTTRHVGDLGNIEEQADSSQISLVMTDSIIQLSGDRSIINKAIVIHEKRDDLGEGGDDESKITGNAGARLECCVIRLDSAAPRSELGVITAMVVVITGILSQAFT